MGHPVDLAAVCLLDLVMFVELQRRTLEKLQDAAAEPVQSLKPIPIFPALVLSKFQVLGQLLVPVNTQFQKRSKQ